jgi:hypothetical protein
MSLNQEDVAAVCRYMNTGMEDTNLYIVQQLGSIPNAESAELSDITESHAHFLVTVGGDKKLVSIPWNIRVGDRADMKTALFGLLETAQSVVI